MTTESERMRAILNLCEGDDLGRMGHQTIDEIYDHILNDYMSEYFEASQQDKKLPQHIKASKKHTGNVVDKAVSDLVNQVAHAYGKDAQTAEDMAFDFALEVSDAQHMDMQDDEGIMNITNLYTMMDNDFAVRMQQQNKSSNDMLGKLFGESLNEGVWAAPQTFKEMHELITILNHGITYGESDAVFSYIGDDDFFDDIKELANEDPMGNLVPSVIIHMQKWLAPDMIHSWNKPWDPKAVRMWKSWLESWIEKNPKYKGLL